MSITADNDTIAHYILIKANKIVAHGAAVKMRIDSTKGMLKAIHVTSDFYLETLINCLSIRCEKEGIKTLYMNFTHLNSDSPRINPYKKLGFKYSEI